MPEEERSVTDPKAQECIPRSPHGAGSPQLAPAGMYVLQCPVEAPAPVWEAAEPVGQVGHLSIVLYGTVGTYLGTFNVVPLRDSNAKDQLVVFRKCCKYSTGVFLVFVRLWGSRKEKEAAFIHHF